MEAMASSLMEQRKPQTLLAFVTFHPTGNPLANATDVQREAFFETLKRMVQENMRSSRQHAELGSITPRHATTAFSTPVAARKETYERALTGRKEREGRPDDDVGVEISGNELHSVIYPATPASFLPACQSLASAIGEHCKSNEHEAQEMQGELRLRLISCNYEVDDLMGVTLLIIEDRMAGEEQDPHKDEPGVGGSWHSATKVSPHKPLPAILVQTAKESAVVRLASVREMLRYYFDRHPKEYRAALQAALGITADQEGDETHLQERLAYELTAIGSFALAQKILAQIKLKKKMDTEKCLLELGYKYDKKNKRFIMGKRTCGTKGQAKRILGALLSSIRGQMKRQ